MARVRLPLQIALAMVAALLSLYLWLRAIGGDPGVAPLRSPAPLATDRIVARFDTPRRLRAHVGRLHEQRSAAAGSRLALSPAAAVRPVAAGASSAGSPRGGGGAAPPAAPRASSSPPPPPPPRLLLRLPRRRRRSRRHHRLLPLRLHRHHRLQPPGRRRRLPIRQRSRAGAAATRTTRTRARPEREATRARRAEGKAPARERPLPRSTRERRAAGSTGAATARRPSSVAPVCACAPAGDDRGLRRPHRARAAGPHRPHADGHGPLRAGRAGEPRPAARL